MTQSTASPAGIDPDRIGAWLADAGVVGSGPLTATRIGLGQSNLTFELVDGAGSRWVLRRPPLGHLLESAHDVAREHRILSALSGRGVPLPGIVGLFEDQGVPQLVTEFVDGVVLDRAERAAQMTAAGLGAVGGSIARTLAAIHAVDLVSSGLDGLASHSPYAERQLRRWSRQLEASRTRQTLDLDRLTTLLQERIPQQQGLALVHGDLHLSNVIGDPETGAVRAALDWELSTLGAPLADLGTMLAYWPEPGEEPVIDSRAMPGVQRRSDLVEAYAAASGRDVDAVPFWHVLGLWKIAIIMEGVRRRVLDEPRNAAQEGPPGTEIIDRVVNAAWSHARGYGL